MASFRDTFHPTSFSIFDSDAQFADEADHIVTFVKRRLGDDTLSVELTQKQIWTCFEESTLIFGGYVNRYQAKSELATLLGQATGSFASGSAGQSQRYYQQTLAFMRRQAEPYAMWSMAGGSHNSVLGYISLAASKQDYDIYTELYNGTTNNLVFGELTGSQKTKMSVIEVFHWNPSAAYRFFDSTSAINYLNNEFSFESFTPETMFYVLPVFEDILRAQMMNVSQRVRRSNYSYDIIGTKLRIYPMPTATPTTPTKLWVRVMPEPDPANPAYEDSSQYGVSNISNVPFGNIQYTNINSIGRDWIRQYTLALCKEVLGLIRSKFKSLPVPNAEVQLNGDDLINQSKETREKLETELKELLDSLTHVKLAEQEAAKAESLLSQLKRIPVPLGKCIVIG